MIPTCKTNPIIAASEILDILASSRVYDGQIEQTAIIEPRNAKYSKPERRIQGALISTLEQLGLNQLYSHQAAAFDLISAGQHVVITTGTGSGKSLCYNLPILDRLSSEPAATALYLFPTKALARDQLRGLESLLPDFITAGVFDGDTPKARRAAIRRSSRILLSNPDMLHAGILPNHQNWSKFFKSLRFVVLDEMHAYTGIFGSHVGQVLRRLLRICELYGSRPTCIATSATIQAPGEVFFQLFQETAACVSDDGAPSGQRTLAIWNPPLIDGTHERRSPYVETASIASAFVKNQIRFLAFASSRLGVELILNYARQQLREDSPQLSFQIEAYRGGYTPKDRRAIEKKIQAREILGLCTTNAMELGVDIGSLDAVVTCGYPGSITGLNQQWGRAGRAGREGLGILVARENPLDQFFVRNHSKLFFRKPEPVHLNISNSYVLADQLLCAAYEHPIAVTDLERFPADSLEICEKLEARGQLTRKAGRWFPVEPESQAHEVNIRSTGREFSIFEGAKWIGSMEEWRSYEYAHPGAIYLHQGQQYLVSDLDIDEGIIRVDSTQTETYTQAIAESSAWPRDVLRVDEMEAVAFSFLPLTVATEVTGYKVRSVLTDEVLSFHELDLPTRTIDTVGIALDLCPAPETKLERWTEGVHAIEHAAGVIAPIVASCDPRDVQSVFYPVWPQTMGPRVYVYDSAPGGTGISELLFESRGAWLENIYKLLQDCRCEDGCPSCVLIPFCPFSNANVSRRAALEVLSGKPGSGR